MGPVLSKLWTAIHLRDFTTIVGLSFLPFTGRFDCDFDFTGLEVFVGNGFLLVLGRCLILAFVGRRRIRSAATGKTDQAHKNNGN